MSYGCRIVAWHTGDEQICVHPRVWNTGVNVLLHISSASRLSAQYAEQFVLRINNIIRSLTIIRYILYQWAKVSVRRVYLKLFE
jgi:hypothetical protein